MGIICLSVHLSGCSVHAREPVSASGLFGGAPALKKAFSPSGKPYSGEWTAKWSYLYPLVTNIPNSGFFTFTPKPAPQKYQRWEVGALRIINSKYYAGEK